MLKDVRVVPHQSLVSLRVESSSAEWRPILEEQERESLLIVIQVAVNSLRSNIECQFAVGLQFLHCMKTGGADGFHDRH